MIFFLILFVILGYFYLGSWNFRIRLIRIGLRINSSFSWTNWIIIGSSVTINTISFN